MYLGWILLKIRHFTALLSCPEKVQRMLAVKLLSVTAAFEPQNWRWLWKRNWKSFFQKRKKSNHKIFFYATCSYTLAFKIPILISILHIKVKKLLLQQLNSNTNSHPTWIFKMKQWEKQSTKKNISIDGRVRGENPGLLSPSPEL